MVFTLGRSAPLGVRNWAKWDAEHPYERKGRHHAAGELEKIGPLSSEEWKALASKHGIHRIQATTYNKSAIKHFDQAMSGPHAQDEKALRSEAAKHRRAATKARNEGRAHDQAVHLAATHAYTHAAKKVRGPAPKAPKIPRENAAKVTDEQAHHIAKATSDSIDKAHDEHLYSDEEAAALHKRVTDLEAKIAHEKHHEAKVSFIIKLGEVAAAVALTAATGGLALPVLLGLVAVMTPAIGNEATHLVIAHKKHKAELAKLNTRNWEKWDAEHPYLHHPRKKKNQSAIDAMKSALGFKSGPSSPIEPGTVKPGSVKKGTIKKGTIKPDKYAKYPPVHYRPSTSKIRPEQAAKIEALQKEHGALLQALSKLTGQNHLTGLPAYKTGSGDLTMHYLDRDLHAEEGGWGDVKPGTGRYGGVMFDGEGRVLLREPTNHYDGYHWTFPKGHPDSGEHPVDTAVRETAEETGKMGQIVGHVPGGFGGTGSSNHYYLMHDSGEEHPELLNNETESLTWATPKEAHALISQSTNVRGRDRDRQALRAAVAAHEALTGIHNPDELPPPEADITPKPKYEPKQYHSGESKGASKGKGKAGTPSAQEAQQQFQAMLDKHESKKPPTVVTPISDLVVGDQFIGKDGRTYLVTKAFKDGTIRVKPGGSKARGAKVPPDLHVDKLKRSQEPVEVRAADEAIESGEQDLAIVVRLMGDGLETRDWTEWHLTHPYQHHPKHAKAYEQSGTKHYAEAKAAAHLTPTQLRAKRAAFYAKAKKALANGQEDQRAKMLGAAHAYGLAAKEKQIEDAKTAVAEKAEEAAALKAVTQAHDDKKVPKVTPGSVKFGTSAEQKAADAAKMAPAVEALKMSDHIAPKILTHSRQENHTGTSDKFYESAVRDNGDGTFAHVTAYGSTKPGAHVTTNAAMHATQQLAQEEHSKAVATRAKHGYKIVPAGGVEHIIGAKGKASASTPPPGSAPNSPVVLTGEVVPKAKAPGVPTVGVPEPAKAILDPATFKLTKIPHPGAHYGADKDKNGKVMGAYAVHDAQGNYLGRVVQKESSQQILAKSGNYAVGNSYYKRWWMDTKPPDVSLNTSGKAAATSWSTRKTALERLANTHNYGDPYSSSPPKQKEEAAAPSIVPSAPTPTPSATTASIVAANAKKFRDAGGTVHAATPAELMELKATHSFDQTHAQQMLEGALEMTPDESSTVLIAQNADGSLAGALSMHHYAAEGFVPAYMKVENVGTMTPHGGAGSALLLHAAPVALAKGDPMLFEGTPESKAYWAHMGAVVDPGGFGVEALGFDVPTLTAIASALPSQVKPSTSEPIGAPKAQPHAYPDGMPKDIHFFDSATTQAGPIGSNPGQWYKMPNGDEYLLKYAKSKDHAENEVAVGLTFRTAGAAVPATSVVDLGNGKYGVVSKKVNALQPVTPASADAASQAAAREHFGIDALTSNYDAFGLPSDPNGRNFFKGGDGKYYRIDSGGGGFYRAMGGPKPSFTPGSWEQPDPNFGPDYESLRKSEQGKLLYGAEPGHHDEEIAASLSAAANLDLGQLNHAMHDAGISSAFRDKYLAVLNDRKAHLQAMLEAHHETPPAATVHSADWKVAHSNGVDNAFELKTQGYTAEQIHNAADAHAASTAPNAEAFARGMHDEAGDPTGYQVPTTTPNPYQNTSLKQKWQDGYDAAKANTDTDPGVVGKMEQHYQKLADTTALGTLAKAKFEGMAAGFKDKLGAPSPIQKNVEDLKVGDKLDSTLSIQASHQSLDADKWHVEVAGSGGFTTGHEVDKGTPASVVRSLHKAQVAETSPAPLLPPAPKKIIASPQMELKKGEVISFSPTGTKYIVDIDSTGTGDWPLTNAASKTATAQYIGLGDPVYIHHSAEYTAAYEEAKASIAKLKYTPQQAQGLADNWKGEKGNFPDDLVQGKVDAYTEAAAGAGAGNEASPDHPISIPAESLQPGDIIKLHDHPGNWTVTEVSAENPTNFLLHLVDEKGSPVTVGGASLSGSDNVDVIGHGSPPRVGGTSTVPVESLKPGDVVHGHTESSHLGGATFGVEANPVTVKEVSTGTTDVGSPYVHVLGTHANGIPAGVYFDPGDTVTKHAAAGPVAIGKQTGANMEEAGHTAESIHEAAKKMETEPGANDYVKQVALGLHDHAGDMEAGISAKQEKDAGINQPAPETPPAPSLAPYKAPKVPAAHSAYSEAYLQAHQNGYDTALEDTGKGGELLTPKQLRAKAATFYAKGKTAKAAGNDLQSAQHYGNAHGYVAAAKAKEAAGITSPAPTAKAPTVHPETISVYGYQLSYADAVKLEGPLQNLVNSGKGGVSALMTTHGIPKQGQTFMLNDAWKEDANAKFGATKGGLAAAAFFQELQKQLGTAPVGIPKGTKVAKHNYAASEKHLNNAWKPTGQFKPDVAQNLKVGDTVLVRPTKYTSTSAYTVMKVTVNPNGTLVVVAKAPTGAFHQYIWHTNQPIKRPTVVPSYPHASPPVASPSPSAGVPIKKAADVIDNFVVQAKMKAKAQPVVFTGDTKSNGKPFHQHPGYHNEAYDAAYAAAAAHGNPTNESIGEAEKLHLASAVGSEEAAKALGAFHGAKAAQQDYLATHKSEAKLQQEKEYLAKVKDTYTATVPFEVDKTLSEPVGAEIPHGIKPTHATTASSSAYDQAIAQGYDQARAAFLKGATPEQIKGTAKAYIEKSNALGQPTTEADILEQAHLAGLAQGAGKAATDLKKNPESWQNASSKSIISQGVLADKSGKGAYTSHSSGNQYAANQSKTQHSFTSTELSAVSTWKGNYRYNKGTAYVKALDTIGAGKDPGSSSTAMSAKRIYQLFIEKAEPNKQAAQRKVYASKIPNSVLAQWKTVGAHINIPLTSFSTDPSKWNGDVWLHVPPGTVSLDIGNVDGCQNEVETIGGGKFLVESVKVEGGVTHIYLKQLEAFAH